MKVCILIFSLLFFSDFAESQSINVTTNIINPCFCRTSSSQNQGGVLSCVVNSGSGSHVINWYNSAGIVFSNNTLIAGLNAGTYIVEVIDPPTMGYFSDTIKLDSVNPIADFNVNSNAIIDLGNNQYQGHVSVDIEFENVSQNFAIPNFAPSDTIFYWSFDTDDPTSWVFKADISAENQTFGPGVYKIGLATENYNGCKDTAFAQITVEETASLQSLLKSNVSIQPNFDQKMLGIIVENMTPELNVAFFDIQGRLIKSIPLTDSKSIINFDQPKGIYIYRLTDGKGNIISRKFQF